MGIRAELQGQPRLPTGSRLPDFLRIRVEHEILIQTMTGSLA